MKNFKPLIPADKTYLPGMKTIMADNADRYRVKYTPDIEYVRRGEKALTLQLLQPGRIGLGEEKKPLLVYVQGSAWMQQDCYGGLLNIGHLARRGYIVASVEYRPSQEAEFPAFLQDVKSAIRFLRAHADEYGIDTERVAVWGDSSGGHAALLAGFTPGDAAFKTEDNQEYSDAVSAIVDFYGPTDVSRINETPRNPVFMNATEPTPEDILLGGCVKENPSLAKPADPLQYIFADKEIPPVLIAHGDIDSVVPFRQSVLIYEKLVECGKVAEFYKVLGAEHGTFMWTEQLLDIVADFLNAYV